MEKGAERDFALKDFGRPAAPADDALRGWRPIETAPKDGTWFLGWWPESRNLGRQEAIMPGKWNDAPHLEEPRFQDVHDNTLEQPTHWMPLSDAPAALSEDRT
ncbi:DUF551 domain-containing protein [Paracoccus beibuensis]|uniref:DUF551 domain-containing protein n=1 Tax=Paracoccus beibuensis TaxID=547602 RepID=UPI00223FD53B|nr:DUF551 domain-containing protein [Paracoccus beibuensis]